jgi:hypothetical protein
MMVRPNGPAATTDGFDWREARYFARLVQMLVCSRVDDAEFRRELERLVSAAEALRSGGPRATGPDRADHCDSPGHSDSPAGADGEAEHAVLALWRRNPSVARDETAPEATADATVSCSATGGVDDAELVRAIDEIERAAAALRAEESGSIAADDGARGPHRRPLRIWLQIAGLWISIAAATGAMIVGLLVFMR